MPKRIKGIGCRGKCIGGARISWTRSLEFRARTENSFSYAGPSEPSVAQVFSIDRYRTADDPWSKGCARHAGEWIHSIPCWASGRVWKKGEAIASGWTAEQTS